MTVWSMNHTTDMLEVRTLTYRLEEAATAEEQTPIRRAAYLIFCQAIRLAMRCGVSPVSLQDALTAAERERSSFHQFVRDSQRVGRHDEESE